MNIDNDPNYLTQKELEKKIRESVKPSEFQQQFAVVTEGDFDQLRIDTEREAAYDRMFVQKPWMMRKQGESN